jgi:RHS repeat-associated protein
VLERDGSGSLLRRYTYGASVGQVPLSMSTYGSEHYYLPDSLGSVADVVSASGTPEWTYTYEPYGGLRAETQGGQGAPDNLMRFTGQLFDPTTGTYHLRARIYDPATGRFLQIDPAPTSSANSAGGTYAYVRGRATVAVDPTGLTCWLLGLHYSDGGCVGGSLTHFDPEFFQYLNDSSMAPGSEWDDECGCFRPAGNTTYSVSLALVSLGLNDYGGSFSLVFGVGIGSPGLSATYAEGPPACDALYTSASTGLGLTYVDFGTGSQWATNVGTPGAGTFGQSTFSSQCVSSPGASAK